MSEAARRLILLADLFEAMGDRVGAQMLRQAAMIRRALDALQAVENET